MVHIFTTVTQLVNRASNGGVTAEQDTGNMEGQNGVAKFQQLTALLEAAEGTQKCLSHGVTINAFRCHIACVCPVPRTLLLDI
jgi:hypothetical protein